MVKTLCPHSRAMCHSSFSRKRESKAPVPRGRCEYLLTNDLERHTVRTGDKILLSNAKARIIPEGFAMQPCWGTGPSGHQANHGRAPPRRKLGELNSEFLVYMTMARRNL
jgi:hypothetical protein